jgi:hypothetical protein
MEAITGSVAEELHAAARAIRRATPATASFHREVAVLLDQVALSAPLVDMNLPPITRKALAVARAFQRPTQPAPAVGLCVQCGQRPAVSEQWCGEECERSDRVSEMRGWAR